MSKGIHWAAAWVLVTCASLLGQEVGDKEAKTIGVFKVTAQAAPIMLGDQVKTTVEKGRELEVIAISGDWYGVLSIGWINKNQGVFTPRKEPVAITQPEPAGSAATTMPAAGQGFRRRPVKRVLLLIDKSGSMPTLFGYVKTELQRFIKELDPDQEFQVIMFSDGPPDELKIDGKGGLHVANESNKKTAFDWIKEKRSRSDKGETSPLESFKKAFSIQPNLPQVIFLLTDGGFPNEVMDYLREVNKEKKVIINTINFASRDGEDILTKMAKENGGTYKYLDESELKKYDGHKAD
jgi:hypothetical protein